MPLAILRPSISITRAREALMKSGLNIVLISLLFMISAGCAKLLPTGQTVVKSPWEDYNSARSEYEKIVPGVTTVADLNKLGFNPYAVPNIRILNTAEIITLFMPTPAIKIENLDPGIQKCIASRDRCKAYQIMPTILDSKRIGNFWADLFSFKRDTVVSGWEFRGLITIVDDVVSYRDPAGGRPSINTEDVQNKPLGPLQDIGGVVTGAAPSLLR